MKMICMQMVGFRRLLQEETKPRPIPKGSEVLLKVKGSGVCHSDLHIWEGTRDMGAGKTVSFEHAIKFPLVMGHEVTGELVAMGPDVKGIELGQMCIAHSWIGCGECPACSVGNEHLCIAPRYIGVNSDGGYADHVLVSDAKYVIPLEGLDPIAAAPLACSGITTYSALKKAGPLLRASTRPVVIGAGGLGLMAIHLILVMGGPAPVVIELDAQKREAAVKAGATAAIDPRAANALALVRAAVGGPLLFIVDLVGSGETAAMGADLLDRGGKMVIVGLYGGAMQIPVPYFPSKMISIQGSFVGTPSEMRELVSLVKSRGMPRSPIDARPLSSINEALEDLKHGKVIGRVVLTP